MFWNVNQRGVVDGCQRLGVTCCLHLKEATDSSETAVTINQTTWRRVREDCSLSRQNSDGGPE
jgi:hypothetical protein